MITVEKARRMKTGFEEAYTSELIIWFWHLMKAADDFGVAKNYRMEKIVYEVCRLVDIELFKRNDDDFEWAMHPWKREAA